MAERIQVDLAAMIAGMTLSINENISKESNNTNCRLDNTENKLEKLQVATEKKVKQLRLPIAV
jgi:hypothetical protein